MVAPAIIAAGISAAATIFGSKGGSTPGGPSHASGGLIAPASYDHSGWNVQIGSGLNVGPGSWLPLLAIAAGLLLVAKGWRPKP